MACLIRAPDTAGKGCVSFTTPERDQVILKDQAARAAVQALKRRYLVGLHHNWHDHDFAYDPLFDFSLAGDGDLIERNGRAFPRVALDACNFAPSCFAPRGQGEEPFWDVLNVSRAVFFKGIPEFFQAIRAIYDRGRYIRVLHLCPVPKPDEAGTALHDIRQRYEAVFAPHERRFFNLMTMDWDYPFPLDLETLAFFYRASRVYVHSAQDERRCRVAAYAWASGIPVVARENVASIVPPALRRRPFWFAFDRADELADAIIAAIDHPGGDVGWDEVSGEFSEASSVARLESFLADLAEQRGESASERAINPTGLDLRLGRHHGISLGANRVEQPIETFCSRLLSLSDPEIQGISRERDPELTFARLGASPGTAATPASSSAAVRPSLLKAIQMRLASYLPFGG